MSFTDRLEKAAKPLCEPAPMRGSYTSHCQGCNRPYANEDVMIVDDVGPVCMNCAYHCARRLLA